MIVPSPDFSCALPSVVAPVFPSLVQDSSACEESLSNSPIPVCKDVGPLLVGFKESVGGKDSLFPVFS